MCCYLYITGVQQLCPVSLPFRSVFLILHVTSLSCLLSTLFIRCGSKLLQCHILDTYALCLKIIEWEVDWWDVPYLMFEMHWLSNGVAPYVPLMPLEGWSTMDKLRVTVVQCVWALVDAVEHAPLCRTCSVSVCFQDGAADVGVAGLAVHHGLHLPPQLGTAEDHWHGHVSLPHASPSRHQVWVWGLAGLDRHARHTALQGRSRHWHFGTLEELK